MGMGTGMDMDMGRYGRAGGTFCTLGNNGYEGLQMF